MVKDEVTGEIKGYYVDLLDELALIGKFNYTLTDIKERNDTRDQQRGIANVLVNELYRNVRPKIEVVISGAQLARLIAQPSNHIYAFHIEGRFCHSAQSLQGTFQ